MLARCLAFARGLFRRRVIDREVDEELAYHLEQETRMHVDRGVPPDEARRLAALSLGGIVQTRDAVRDVRTTVLESAWRETRHGIRALRATPAFTGSAVIVLALGIGGTTAVFSVLDSLLLRPLPYPDAEALVRVWSRNDDRQIPFLSVSPADYEDWRKRAGAARQVGAYDRSRVLQPDGGEPVAVMSVTPDLFPTLGIAPSIGRGLRHGDAAGSAAVISHTLWQRHFGGARDAVGRSLGIGEYSWTVIGVMPPRFEVPIAAADVWVPLDTRISTDARFAHTLRVVARAAPGADAAAVIARDLEAVAAQLAVERPAENGGWSVTVLPLFDVVVSPDFRRSLWIVAGAVLFVLLMASISAAALLLTRASSRQRELAVRVALGASRGSLVRLLLMESLVLGVLAGLAGLVVAAGGVTLLQSTGAATVPRVDEISLSGRVFAFAAAVTLLSALGAAVLPAWRSTRGLHEMLRSRGEVSVPASTRALHTLVLVEVASAVLLVVGAALLAQTVLNLHWRGLGFDWRDLVAIDAIWPSVGESDLVVRTEDALSRVAALPGVSRVAAVSALPFSGRNSGDTFLIEGQIVPGAPLPDADYRVVSPRYFETVGIPVLAGRDFTGADGGPRGAVIVSQTAARRFWLDGDVIGRRLRMGRSDWLTIVGVVGDVRYLGLDDPSEAVRQMLYVPHREMPSTPMTLVLRSGVRSESLAASLRTVLTSEAGIGITRIETMNGMLRDASAPQRFTMNLVIAFAATAVTLAGVALYGLLAFVIARRTKEIGVRVALGAQHGDVVRMVASRTLLLVGMGVGVGLAASRALSEALRGALFGVSPHDPVTYISVAFGFFGLAIAAATLPTIRALRIDPVRVIRAE